MGSATEQRRTEVRCRCMRCSSKQAQRRLGEDPGAAAFELGWPAWGVAPGDCWFEGRGLDQEEIGFLV
jgi:hypothetical protein